MRDFLIILFNAGTFFVAFLTFIVLLIKSIKK